MTKPTKIRAKAVNGIVDFRMLMRHEMESGFRKDDKTGKTVPAWFIKEFRVFLNNEAILVGYIGPLVSKNPYFRFNFAGKAGDTVKVSWIDNRGVKRVHEDLVKAV
ncbi:thiosulfate oxidation carrier complex protein SoxZ [Betaproteobacteria bacterium]|nr:thiosulfate oxidation carrier complex protein SoxZ [Betaproteobacteria bacterium]